MPDYQLFTTNAVQFTIKFTKVITKKHQGLGGLCGYFLVFLGFKSFILALAFANKISVNA
jgi:hypothetical protein